MIYAILAYHEEPVVAGWSAAEDEALMDDLNAVHRKLTDLGQLGPAARLGPTASARTVRRGAKPVVLDGPFAETKEQLLGFYVVDCVDMDEAIAAAEDLQRVNTSATYEVRPVILYLPGAPVEGISGA